MGEALWTDDRSEIRRAVFDQGADAGGGCGGFTRAVDLTFPRLKLSYGPSVKAGASPPDSMKTAGLKPLFLLGGRETGDVVPGGVSFGLDANQRFGLGSRFAHNYHGAKSFRIQAGHQIDVAGGVLLPKLANLDFLDAHFHSYCRGGGPKVSTCPRTLLPTHHT